LDDPVPHEQRYPYQGFPPRAWISVRLATPQGDTRDWKLIADIGCPFPLVIGVDDLPDFSFGAGNHVQSNFGILESAWLHLAMPEFGLDFLILGYGSEEVLDSARTDHPDFGGLAGLPFLRLLEYGGNASEFWIRSSERPA
jgi:hypothetical protein